MRFLFAAALAAALPLATMAPAQQAADSVAPEAATPARPAFAGLSRQVQSALRFKAAGRSVEARDWMIVAANPLAAEAGAKILETGGTAADAMVAAQAVLGLVEPQSSGLGGGAFLVWYDGTNGTLTTLDARETAPLAAQPTLFLDESGEPMGFFDAVVGGRSVGTPGTPRLLEEAHRRWGRASWPALFADAIRLAEEGFEVSPRLAQLVAEDGDRLKTDQATAAYFFPGGTAIAAGDTLANPDYAETLRLIADRGVGAFYTGPLAEDVVRKVREAENPGLLGTIDLALYQVKERTPVCVTYRAHDVCGMGPPSSGALTVGQILGMLEGYDLATLGPAAPESWRLIGDASRLAFADRGRFIADSDFVPVPADGLVAPSYLADRARLLATDTALPEVAPGEPEWDHAMLWGDGTALDLPSTSQISIVDADGNALSMTTTIENAFGSRLFVRGFLLNNELTDFSFRSHEDGRPVANAVAPGKRPRSSMAPTIVLKDDLPVMVLGSPGGSQIIGYVAQAIIAHLDWGMDMQQAVSAPHLLNRFGPFELEAGTEAEALAAPLAGMGFKTTVREMNSGLNAIAIGEVLQGGSDPRREGIVLGD